MLWSGWVKIQVRAFRRGYFSIAESTGLTSDARVYVANGGGIARAELETLRSGILRVHRDPDYGNGL